MHCQQQGAVMFGFSKFPRALSSAKSCDQPIKVHEKLLISRFELPKKIGQEAL